jgi:hypothetical protein
VPILRAADPESGDQRWTSRRAPVGRPGCAGSRSACSGWPPPSSSPWSWTRPCPAARRGREPGRHRQRHHEDGKRDDDHGTRAGHGRRPGQGHAPATADRGPEGHRRAELAAEAARLTRRLDLSSPAGWDQYLPAGKTYPGADTADDIATCPHLAARLSAALGKKMSYWTGTLPDGPYGCSWVPVPLSYDGPYTYAYQLDVGYLADGTTTAQLRTGFHENGPETCPGVDVPAVAPDAVLVRCQQPTDLEYSLALPDSRRPGGVWLLHASARTGAPHSAAEALDALVAAVTGVDG